jgi:hypothetical protein
LLLMADGWKLDHGERLLEIGEDIFHILDSY